ncbi:hypothetical protein ABFX02_08G190300 [Erythranthe guttata]
MPKPNYYTIESKTNIKHRYYVAGVNEEESERTQSQHGRNGTLFDILLPGEKRPAGEFRVCVVKLVELANDKIPLERAYFDSFETLQLFVCRPSQEEDGSNE